MKIRMGFVSNSSSCSHIVLGVELSKEQYDKILTFQNRESKWDELRKEAEYWVDENDIYLDGFKKGYAFGVNMASVEDYEEKRISTLQFMMEESTNIVSYLAKCGIEFDMDQIKVICTVQEC